MIQRLKRHLPTIFAVAATAALVAPGVRADDWPTLGGNERRTGMSDEKIAPPLSLLWRFTGVPQTQTASAATPPTVVGETAYFAAKNNPDTNAGSVLFALDTKTGARRWVFPNDYGLKDKAVFQTAPVVNNDRIYIGASDGYLYIVDAKNGREINKIRTSGAVGGTPLIEDGTIYFGSNDNTVYAFDLETLTASGNWRAPYKTSENINSALIAGDGYLFFTTADQNVHAVTKLSGRSKWRNRIPFKFAPDSLIYADNSLYIPSGPRLYAIQPTSGSFRWSLTFPGEILAPPVAADGNVFVTCRDSASQEFRMYAVRSSNHRTAWDAPAVLPAPPSAAATIVGDVIYVPTKRGIVVALSKDDGKMLWQYRSEPSANRANVTLLKDATVTSPIAAASGTLFVPTDDGSLTAFRPDAPDTTPPILSARYPIPAQSIYGGPGMVITANITDPGSGIDTDSLKMAIDGVEVTTGYNESLNIAYYQRPRSGKQVDKNASFPNGRHTVTLTAKDYRGNTLTETWSFVVDNNMKAPSVNYDTNSKTRPANASTTTPRPPAPRGIGGKPAGKPGGT